MLFFSGLSPSPTKHLRFTKFMTDSTVCLVTPGMDDIFLPHRGFFSHWFSIRGGEWHRPRIYSLLYPYIRYQSHSSWDPQYQKFTNLIKDPKIQRTWILAKTSLELLLPKICWGNQNIPETCRTYLAPQQNFTEPCRSPVSNIPRGSDHHAFCMIISCKTHQSHPHFWIVLIS